MAVSPDLALVEVLEMGIGWVYLKGKLYVAFVGEGAIAIADASFIVNGINGNGM